MHVVGRTHMEEAALLVVGLEVELLGRGEGKLSPL
jgi:hypothetical protein